MSNTTAAGPSRAEAAGAYNLAAIDYTRVVMAFLVLMIHLPPFTSINAVANYAVQQYITRIGVPFFFLCNGYFLFRPGLGGQALRKNALAQVKRMASLYVLWVLLYLPIMIYGLAKGAAGDYFRFWGQLWYLRSAAFAVFLVWFALSRGCSWRVLLLISGALYIFGLRFQGLGGYIWPLPEQIFNIQIDRLVFVSVIARNGLCYGFLLVALGAYFANHPLPPVRVCRIGFGAAMAAGLIETFALYFIFSGSGADMYAFLPFTSTFLFCGLLQLPTNKHPDTRVYRKFSTLIYLTHAGVIFLYEEITGGLAALIPAFSVIAGNSLISCIMVCLCATALSRAVILLSDTKRFSWLKKLY